MNAVTPIISGQDPLLSKALDYRQWQNATALFAPFAARPWAMLLDSANAAHPNSRYDILVRQPVSTLVVNDAASEADPFPHLARQLASIAPYQGEHELPFTGGALGYLAYDAGRAIEQVGLKGVGANPGQQPIRDIKLPDIALGFYNEAIIIDHQAQQSYLLAPASRLDNALADWQPLHALGSVDFQLTGPWQSNLTEAEYHQRIAAIHDHLRAGDCYQINLAQRFSASYQGNEWQAYLHLRAANQAPFSAYLRLEQGCVLSVSPERFIASDATGHVETKPIKGTRPRHQNPQLDAQARVDLRKSAKDQAENLMIVDLLRNDLSRVCQPGSVHVPTLFGIESFAAVHHLVSTIHGQLADPLDSVALLRAAFPGGSITGAPKVAAMNIINALEPHRRSVYCGSIGYINQSGACDLNIAIRTLVASEQRIHCWAGGGIVMDSEAHAEYQETFDKVQRILPVLEQLNQ